MQQCFFNVPSMHNLTSARKISYTIENIKGVKNVNTNYEKSLVGVFYERNHSILNEISNEVEKLGYEINLIL